MILSVFTIYGHGGHIGDHLCKFSIPFNRRLNMKFEENWPRVSRAEVVQRCGRTDDGRMDDDGRGRHVITIAHPKPCSGELKNHVL